MANSSASSERVLTQAGVPVRSATPASLIEPLPKLVTGLAASERLRNVVPGPGSVSISTWSPVMSRSPSYATIPISARTSPNGGVRNPEIGTSSWVKLLVTRPNPSYTVRLRAGRASFS